ncbi:DUF932 domain-containing protein [Balneolaceae bacterium ANBcel3]|nr:DUF932 domain-containing protein [Balneolaceae bacterium ANBcel3]
MNLQPFCFPVIERPVFVDNADGQIIDPENPETFLTNGHKAIVREDTNELISIVKSSYEVVRNADLIDSALRELAVSGTSFRIDPSHSFVDNNRMRLQITFPELKMRDRESDLALSVFIHNSYDCSESVRFFFGAIRAICSNGMVFGEVLARYSSRHTSGFNLSDLGDRLHEAASQLDVIQQRIDHLEVQPVTDELMVSVSENISKRLAEQVISQEEIGRLSQYTLLNRLTNHISHQIEPRKRAPLQKSVSKVFSL